MAITRNMKNVVILVAIIGICLIAATIPVVNAASDNYNVRIRWLEFVHEKLVMDDYILQVEFEVPSIGHYEAKRTPCARYLSELTPLEFNAQESWLSLSAKLTITAFWHLNDVIIDINPNPADGRWIPGAYFEEAAKRASALVVSYTIGNEPMQFSADGNDDGYVSDLNNDAYIKFVVETLKDGEVIPEFPTWTAWLVAIAVSTLVAISGAKKNTLQKLRELMKGEETSLEYLAKNVSLMVP